MLKRNVGIVGRENRVKVSDGRPAAAHAWTGLEELEPRLLLTAVPVVLPVVSIVTTTPTAVENGLVAGAVTVSIDTAQAADLKVSLTASGTAKAGKTYVAVKSVIIPHGTTSVLVPIKPVDDKAGTGDLSAILTLKASKKAYTLGVNKSATVTIVDKEPKVSLIASGLQLTEAAGPNHTVTLTLTSAVPAPAVVGLKVYGKFTGTAKSGKNYSLPLVASGKGFVIILPGSTTLAVPLTGVNDQCKLGNKTIILTMGKGKGYYPDPLNNKVTISLIDAS